MQRQQKHRYTIEYNVQSNMPIVNSASTWPNDTIHHIKNTT